LYPLLENWLRDHNCYEMRELLVPDLDPTLTFELVHHVTMTVVEHEEFLTACSDKRGMGDPRAMPELMQAIQNIRACHIHAGSRIFSHISGTRAAECR